MPHMLSAFRGHIVTLLRHPCGAIVVDELYDHANKKQKGQIASEFYGPEVALLANLATGTFLCFLPVFIFSNVCAWKR